MLKGLSQRVSCHGVTAQYTSSSLMLRMLNFPTKTGRLEKYQLKVSARLTNSGLLLPNASET